MGVGAGSQIDLGPRDVQKAQRIACGQRPGFVAADNIVGNRCHGRGSFGGRTQRGERINGRHEPSIIGLPAEASARRRVVRAGVLHWPPQLEECMRHFVTRWVTGLSFLLGARTLFVHARAGAGRRHSRRHLGRSRSVLFRRAPRDLAARRSRPLPSERRSRHRRRPDADRGEHGVRLQVHDAAGRGTSMPAADRR